MISWQWLYVILNVICDILILMQNAANFKQFRIIFKIDLYELSKGGKQGQLKFNNG